VARFAVGVVFGIVVTTALGAALGSHAQSVDAADDTGDEAPASPPVVEVPEEAAPAAPSGPAYGVYDRLAACESTSRWNANTGNSYYGGLQMDMTFWRRHGGLQYASRPDLASRAAQIAVAQVGQSVQGFGAWPVCARRLGLLR
jgi:hypothetical protein